ncbi:MAG TPA: 23S rRNA (adenine(2503)-C(2))-methyltransferase RlmN [Myxococcota bacterium]|nr:23S rRNA (adenine(2503)-C(2))-methyltransferase RlmN [Myxococcota bacterium]
MSFDQIQDWMVEKGESAYRGRQVFRWLHARAVRSFDEMTDLSRDLRAKLTDLAPLRMVEIADELKADDGTIKFRYVLHDGLEVEGVYMPAESRRTLCISTQVGCGMGCAFCATGTMGLSRNLAASEICGQFEVVTHLLRGETNIRPVTNVVFMGMGEPLANLDAVVRAIEILLHEHGAGLSRRRITVSTVGIVTAMEEFVSRVPVKLAISLNAASDDIRSKIMPINKRFGLGRLLDCCRRLPLSHNDRLTFEYVLLSGVNDSDADARRLAGLLSGIRCKVNLIPYNTFEPLPFERPSGERVERFQSILIAGDLSVFIRRSQGESLRAACGQLLAVRGSHE